MVKQWALLVATVALLGSTAQAGHRHHRCCKPGPATCASVPSCAAAPSCGSGACGSGSSGCNSVVYGSTGYGSVGYASSGDASGGCGPAMVEQTVMEPVMTTEVRKVSATEYRQEQRERKYTVSRQVPRTETKSRTVTYYETNHVRKKSRTRFTTPLSTRSNNLTRFRFLTPNHVREHGQ